MAVESLYCEWADVNAAFYRTRNYMSAGSDPTSYLAALTALLNAGLQQHTNGGVTTFDAAPPTVGTYDSFALVGQLTYICADGSEIRVMLPALLATLVGSGGVSIPAANVSALTTEVIALLTNNLESPVTAFVNGVLTARKADQT